MEVSHRAFPRLRPVEAIPDPQNARVILRDPTQLAAGMLVVGEAELLLLGMMDGSHGLLDIRSAYARQTGQLLLSRELDGLLDQLDNAGFLAGAGFDAYYAGLVEEYRAAPYRALRDPDGFGRPAGELPQYLEEALDAADAGGTFDGRLTGIVTPHLDFERGLPCYGAGYAELRRASRPRRVVILGTNHFGRSRSVVATTKDFQSPWGVVPTDARFLRKLEAASGGKLALYELDHLREHSVELQVVWLHHLLGADLRIVPVLCPDPSGPLGTKPGNPGGVDLREFARALGKLVREDDEPTLLIASADLSHVGGYFGDDGKLTNAFLQEVGEADQAALDFVDRNEPEAFREHMARTGNPTRVCSVGCIYALMTALGSKAAPRRLRYHQAVTPEAENTVTCAAYAFYS